jgi:hypothetical protein
MLEDLLNAYYKENKEDWQRARGKREEPYLTENGSLLPNKYTLWETYNLDNGE